MKKLKLKSSELGRVEELTREELKKVLGGESDEGSGSGSGNTYFCQCANGGSIYVQAPGEPQALELSNKICTPYTIGCYPSFI